MKIPAGNQQRHQLRDRVSTLNSAPKVKASNDSAQFRSVHVIGQKCPKKQTSVHSSSAV